MNIINTNAAKKSSIVKLLFISIFISIAISSLSSCKKKEVVPINTNQLQLLTNNNTKTWILKDITTMGKSIIEDCARDDLYTFDKTTLLVTYTPNNTCYFNDIASQLPYELNENLSWLTIDGFVYIIDEISETKLVISHDGKDENSKLNAENQVLHEQQTLTLVANK